ncbi:hypothetical protein LLG96_04590 [bacterium]|nr:hypothetical protein [bacterium]
MSGQETQYEEHLRAVLRAAQDRDYAGYSKFDALNSPLLRILSLNNRWLRLAYTQAVKACPFNIRPHIGVRQSRNPKGIALFARAYLFLHEKTGDRQLLDEAETLIRWLLDNPSPGRNNLCWGYNFIWQNTIFLQDMYEPNLVVTVFAGEALIHAYRTSRREEYLECARSVARFILDDLPVLHENEDERAVAYVVRKVDAVVLNNNALAGAFLIKLWKETGDESLRSTAQKLLSYTVNRRTDYYAWYYTHPKEKSPITHDNYHTGGILDALLDYYEESGDDRFMNIYRHGLAFYREHLFDKNGAPRWMNDKRYPHDIHGAAQGIITFTKASRHVEAYREQATTIAEWARNTLYRPETHDYAYRKGRFMTWNYSLMRWCNAWMARALGELLTVK